MKEELRGWEGIGAGDGNRTRMASLEGWSSTIELRPHCFAVEQDYMRCVEPMSTAEKE